MEVLDWISTARRKAQQFLGDLRRYGLCRTLRFQFGLIAKRQSKKPSQKQERSSGEGGRPEVRRPPSEPGLAYVKYLEAEQRRAEALENFRVAGPQPPKAGNGHYQAAEAKGTERSCSTRLDGPA